MFTITSISTCCCCWVRRQCDYCCCYYFICRHRFSTFDKLILWIVLTFLEQRKLWMYFMRFIRVLYTFDQSIYVFFSLFCFFNISLNSVAEIFNKNRSIWKKINNRNSWIKLNCIWWRSLTSNWNQFLSVIWKWKEREKEERKN